MADLSKLTDEQLGVYKDLLAKKQGPPSEKEAYAPAAPQTFGHAGSEALSAANPLPGLVQMVRHPIETGKGLIKQQLGEFPKASEAFRSGDYMEATRHALGGLVPLLGPAAVAMGDQMAGTAPKFDKFGHVLEQGEQPDVAGALGRAAGTIGGVAALPAVTKGIGTSLKAGGEGLVRSALRLPAKAEAFGATPARAVLEETSGVRPATIARTGQERINTLKPQMEGLVSKATKPVDLTPSRTSVADAEALAARQGNKLVHGQIQPMREALEGNRVTGASYPPQISPSEALDLKRGFGDEFATFNPDLHTSTNALAKNVYGQLRRGIHESAPGTQEIDQRIQSLIPAIHRAETISRGAGLGERVLNRISRPTGGMLPALLGFHEGGVPGAALGMVGSEAAASPVPLMIGARSMFGAGRGVGSPLVQRGVQAAPLVKLPKRSGEE